MSTSEIINKMEWMDENERLEPMPPPPAPIAHPSTKLPTPYPIMPHTAILDVGEPLVPQSPPVPHTHPLVALSDKSARKVTLQCEEGGMANRSGQRTVRYHSSITGKRLDPTFLNSSRIKAFTDRQEDAPQQSVNPFAHETEHSSRAIALQLQQQAEEMEKVPGLTSLGEEERKIAATEASDRRHELARVLPNGSSEGAEKYETLRIGEADSALARASERKVKKQLNAKWAQSRQDPANRPKGPLERLEEQHLRETLFRTTARDLLQSEVLFDKVDAKQNATFGQLSKLQLPVVTNRIVGLVGSCFED